ncbi:hypothetical protein J437_LFUL019233 [Ladona fulva]|uniref:Golgin-84 n=1 Tax=Ladona fulva TaxID=123851 RepID=A0A8K0KTZ1_LADFU|nr:hypothetical protein J437_LFUL019233 [Ladona fulva]
MSWLSGLAGKAEDLLNKIDQNAAIALQKEPVPQFRPRDSVVVEVSDDGLDVSLPSRPSDSVKSYGAQNIHTKVDSFLPSVKSYPSLPSIVGTSSGKTDSGKSLLSKEEDELMKYLNSPKTVGTKSRKVASLSYNGSPASSSPSKKSVSCLSTPKHASAVDNMDGLETQNAEVTVDVMEIEDLKTTSAPEIGDNISSLSEENGVLKRELQSTEQDSYLLRKKLKESQREIDLLKESLISTEECLKEAQEMHAAVIEDCKKISETATMENFKNQAEINRLKGELAQSMDEKSRALESLKDKLEAEISAARSRNNSLQNRYDSLMEELKNERLEQERYRARAQAVLAGRDREIAELRGRKDNTQDNSEDTMHFEEMESEKERLRLEEEVFDLREQVANLKAALDEGRRQWDKDREAAEDELIMERGRREAAEEETKSTLEELRTTRDEVMKLRQEEMELRQKLSNARKAEEAKSRSSGRREDWGGRVPVRGEVVQDAVEDSASARLAALTSTLVEKQVRLESLTAERNALRLQLEKTDHLYRDAVAHLGQMPNGPVAGQNDTDDAKARIPSFLLESPFDTAVTRKVKRAYSSLDAVGVRVGIFLRRYPLARTLLLSYTVLLHLWVAVVLLTYTPDAH